MSHGGLASLGACFVVNSTVRKVDILIVVCCG